MGEKEKDGIVFSLDEHGWANVDELIAGIAKTQLMSMEIYEQRASVKYPVLFLFASGKSCDEGTFLP